MIGIFDASPPAASYALSRLDGAIKPVFHDVGGADGAVVEPNLQGAERGFTGPASIHGILNGHQDHSQWWAGRRARVRPLHLAELFGLRTQGGCSPIPTRDARRKTVLRYTRHHRKLMRIFSGDHRWLSLNTANRPQGRAIATNNRTPCGRHMASAHRIPEREGVADHRIDRAVRAVREARVGAVRLWAAAAVTSDAAHRSRCADDKPKRRR